jgi:hypothetical protein
MRGIARYKLIKKKRQLSSFLRTESSLYTLVLSVNGAAASLSGDQASKTSILPLEPMHQAVACPHRR